MYHLPLGRGGERILLFTAAAPCLPAACSIHRVTYKKPVALGFGMPDSESQIRGRCQIPSSPSLSCISISNWPLSCPPSLQDKKIMDLYQNSREAKRFTFTCSATGSTHRFESVAFPGWYLSTSPRNDQPLQVTNRLGEAEITNFYFKKV
uniref:Interleukin-1 receptor antagonist protein n=1 Tax=Gopherus evgoodei TaxID=1825980 RepID=A0A8C4VE21_9SAUR